MVTVRVPASTANLGPGFDCLGIALNLFNTFIIEEIAEGLEITGCPDEYKNSDNLVYTSMKLCFEKIGYTSKGISIKMNCDIPVSSGLGSSSSCILGGMLAANHIAGNILSKEEILNLATSLEGHGDNLSPSLYGGLTVSLYKENKVYCERFPLYTGLNFYALTPDFPLSTKDSRGVLPNTLDFKAGVSNVGSCALLLSSLIKGNYNNIKISCDDQFHEPYRAKLIPNFYEIKDMSLNFGAVGVFLSGAGPTIMALVTNEHVNFNSDLEKYLNTLDHKWTIRTLSICNEGSTITI